MCLNGIKSIAYRNDLLSRLSTSQNGCKPLEIQSKLQNAYPEGWDKT